MAETCTQHLLYGLLGLHSGLRKHRRQFISLLATAAPERQLADVEQQRCDEHLFLVARHHIAGNIACLYRCMKGASQQFLQLVSRRPVEQAVNQAHRQADQADVVEADHDDRAGDRLDGLLRGVVIAAVADPQDLRGERRVAQQDIGQLLHRSMLLLGQPLQVLDHPGQRRQFGLVQAFDPSLQTLTTCTQRRPPCRFDGIFN
ncbi:hypothetical protein D3C77_343280 [compost metagenome]